MIRRSDFDVPNPGIKKRRRIPKKLTTEKIREIIALKGERSQRQLAKEYGVSQPLICYIQNGLRWENVVE